MSDVATATMTLPDMTAIVSFAAAMLGLLVISIGLAWRLLRRLDRIDAEVLPNGDDDRLPEDDRGLPLRTLVTRSRIDIARIRERFGEHEEETAVQHRALERGGD